MENLFASYDLSRFEVQDKILHEYQAIGKEMEEYFPKNEHRLIWMQFNKYHYKDIERAFNVCQKKGIKTIRYLIGILKKT